METQLNYLRDEVEKLTKKVSSLEKHFYIAFGIAGALNWILVNFVK